MAIESGTHLGPYEIMSAIGEGGMGEVCRARDPKLGRDVAINIFFSQPQCCYDPIANSRIELC